MKATFNNWYRALTAMLLTMLGFSSCGGNGQNGADDIECLYGTPTSTFQVKGNVTDEEGNPIQGIKTKVEVKYGASKNDSVYTDSKGNYLLEKCAMTGIPTTEKDIVKVIFEDVDGEANGGTFANDTVQGNDLTIKQTSERKGTWNLGSYEITANAKLKKKQ